MPGAGSSVERTRAARIAWLACGLVAAGVMRAQSQPHLDVVLSSETQVNPERGQAAFDYGARWRLRLVGMGDISRGFHGAAVTLRAVDSGVQTLYKFESNTSLYDYVFVANLPESYDITVNLHHGARPVAIQIPHTTIAIGEPGADIPVLPLVTVDTSGPDGEFSALDVPLPPLPVHRRRPGPKSLDVVLIVDDSPSMRPLMGEVVKSIGLLANRLREGDDRRVVFHVYGYPQIAGRPPTPGRPELTGSPVFAPSKMDLEGPSFSRNIIEPVLASTAPSAMHSLESPLWLMHELVTTEMSSPWRPNSGRVILLLTDEPDKLYYRFKLKAHRDPAAADGAPRLLEVSTALSDPKLGAKVGVIFFDTRDYRVADSYQSWLEDRLPSHNLGCYEVGGGPLDDANCFRLLERLQPLFVAAPRSLLANVIHDSSVAEASATVELDNKGGQVVRIRLRPPRVMAADPVPLLVRLVEAGVAEPVAYLPVNVIASALK